MREILLPRSFDIAVVRAVAAVILNALALGDLTLDASEVTKIDAAGLQLLCAAVAAARTGGAAVAWKGVPSVLADGARILALADALDLPRAPPQERR